MVHVSGRRIPDLLLEDLDNGRTHALEAILKEYGAYQRLENVSQQAGAARGLPPLPPGTKEWVFGKGWLKRFFTALEANADWLKLRSFRECLDQTLPRGRVYLPLASYEEMMEWALPAAMIPPF